MKKVIKVSIGSLAFTVEEDGFLILKGYLDEIQDHYGSGENGKEIVEGIEERMAELFNEKCGTGTVISAAVVSEVVSILGRPSAIDEEQGEYRTTGGRSNWSKRPRKLYRNPDNKVLGGVCSGLAAYLSLDVLLVRILYFILFLGFSFFGLFVLGGASFMVITYIILWIVIPEAKTMEQKYAMYGEQMDLANIHARVESEISRGKQSMKRGYEQGRGALNSLGRLISVIFSVFLVVFAVSGITFLSFMLLGVELFKGIIPINVLDYVHLGVSNPLWLKVFVLAFLFLPLLGMLYTGIQILFRFRSPRIKPGLIIFLLWIGSVVGLGFLSVKSSRPYWEEAVDGGELMLSKSADTLYVDFNSEKPMPADRVMLDAGHSRFSMFWMEGYDEQERVVVFPRLRIVRQSSEPDRLVKYRTQAFGLNYAEALLKAQQRVPSISMDDSVITISPVYYGTNNKWDGTNQQVSLYVPDSVVVIVRKPFYHDFDKRVKKEWFDHDRYNRVERWSKRMERRLDY